MDFVGAPYIRFITPINYDKQSLYDYKYKRNHKATSQKPLKALQSSKIAPTKLNDFTKAWPQTLNQYIIRLIGVEVVFAHGMKVVRQR